MDYKVLSEEFYKNPSEYESLFSSRYNAESTIHLPFDIHKNPAFICLSPEIVNLIYQIMQTDKKIQNVCRNLPNIALNQFKERSLIDEILLTNDIEGVYSSRKEIGEALDCIKENGPKKRFYGLVNKYHMLSEDDMPLNTCQDIRHIYDELVLEEVVSDNPNNEPDGKLFRKDLAEVTTATGKVIHNGSYPEKKIIADMSSALNILKLPNIPSIIKVAIFHYLFGYIHPFYDGNGRTSRFISSYLLAKELNSLIGYRLSYTIKQKIKDYYEAFKVCNNPQSRGDITPFVIVFMEIVNDSMTNLLSALEKRLTLLLNYDNKIKELGCFNEQQLQFCYVLLQARLFSEHGISKKELQSLYSLSYASIDKKLRYIEEQGYLTKCYINRVCYCEFNTDKL